jgi:heat shock protein HtpX
MALASALGKLQKGVVQLPINAGNPSDSHLFIVNPFLGGLSRLLSTHPPVEKRISRLEKLVVTT